MNLLFLAPRYYPHIGGVEYVIKSIAERLAKVGHEVTVLVGESNIKRSGVEEINCVRVIRWPIFANIYHIPKDRKNLGRLVYDLVRDTDIVHAHSAHDILPIQVALDIKRISPEKKLIVSLYYHGSGHSFTSNLLWKLYWRSEVSKVIRLANKVHAISSREAELISSHYPYAKSKLVIIPSGVDEDVLQYRWIGWESNYIIYAGRIEKYKRLELAIKIAKKIGLKLIIVGEGAYRKNLEKYIKERYPELVRFYQPQPRGKYLEMLSKARYAINPSRHEAFSIFVAEALSMGTPAIISREIAENLRVEVDPFNDELFIAKRAKIETWNNVLTRYTEKLYR
jgi:glycosyltransferase involved in cell wall biosynthesis